MLMLRGRGRRRWIIWRDERRGKGVMMLWCDVNEDGREKKEKRAMDFIFIF